ncbi:hypothetical protein ACIPY5_12800 [Microbacterium sp. NPDC089698]|uniref:hypothetical protein n=1 Tax=Microbacterium sp. NPDC089698 TaxID=3364200 RepID=UPI003826450F
MEDTTSSPSRSVSRRALVKGAAWSVPVIAVAAATPLAAASTATNVGNFALNGTCGVLGVLGPGFTLTAGNVALPVGTIINITGSGIANIGVFSVTGGTATVNVLSPTSRQITLTAPLAAGATIDFRTTLSISVAFQLAASTTLPTGFVAGSGAKQSGGVNATLILCSAS